MLRTYLLGLFAILTSIPVYSQGFTENFSSNSLPSGWNNSFQISGGVAWTFSGGMARVTNTAIGLTQVAGPSWLITSALTPEPGYGTLVFRISYPLLPAVGNTNFEVRISEGPQNQLGGYQSLYSFTRSTLVSGPSGEVRVKIPMSYWGKPCFIAFLHTVNGLAASDGIMIDDISLQPDVLYSVGSGPSSSSIWSATPTGAAGPPVITPNTHVIVQSGHAVQLNSTAEVFQLTINPNAQFTLQNQSISLHGSVTNKGVFQARSGHVKWIGKYGQVFDGNGTFGDVDVNSPGGLVFFGGTSVLYGYLRHLSGSIQTNDALVVGSDNAGTGGIGPLPLGVWSGKVVQQRYLQANPIDWRFISFGVKGATLNELNDDTRTTGYPGSVSPNDPFVSVRTYNEALQGPFSNGFVGPFSSAQAILPTQGYYFYARTASGSAGEVQLDVGGQLFVGDTTLSLNKTNSPFPPGDGFHLVGNPYCAQLQFSDLPINGIFNGYWQYNPLSGNLSAWSEELKTGSSGLNGVLASGQGFVVKVKASTGTLQFKEAAKRSPGHQGVLNATDPVLSLAIAAESGSFSDEALFVLSSKGVKGLDEVDVPKVELNHPDAPFMAITDAGSDLMISVFDDISLADTVSFKIQARKSGNYILRLGQLRNMTNRFPVLIDLISNERYPVDSSLDLRFSMFQGQILTNFKIVFVTAPQYSSVASNCNGDGLGYLSALGPGSGPFTYTWRNTQGVVIRTVTSTGGADTLRNVPGGAYTVEIATSYLPLISKVLELVEPSAIVITGQVTNETCRQNNDGTILVTVTGGTGDKFLFWNIGSFSPYLEGLQKGIYTVTATDQVGCMASKSFEVREPDSLNASVTTAKDTYFLLEEVRPTVQTNLAVNEYLWDFGDGFTSTDETPMHRYNASGIFTIRLTTGNGFCSTTSSKSITVLPTTGLANAEKDIPYFEWRGVGELAVYASNTIDEFNVWDSQGRLLAQEVNWAKGEWRVVNLGALPSGVYVLGILRGEKVSTIKVQYSY
ncbi:MAG TPA: PKD domain-containing protein [Luteibaculaceae bacterium]|nr:PKD domain-containing protein [Luteibaculaceae bacterium]